MHVFSDGVDDVLCQELRDVRVECSRKGLHFDSSPASYVRSADTVTPAVRIHAEDMGKASSFLRPFNRLDEWIEGNDGEQHAVGVRCIILHICSVVCRHDATNDVSLLQLVKHSPTLTSMSHAPGRRRC